MVDAAKLRRAQEKILSARPYAAAMLEVLTSVASRVEKDHPLLRERPEKNALLLIVTADKGLCGAFNANVIRAAQHAIRDHAWSDVKLLPIGRKANDFFRRRSWPIRHRAVNVFQALSPETANEIAKLIIEDYAAEKVDAVYVIYNEFKSVIQQNLRLEKILPFHRLSGENEHEIDYLYEPGPEQILTELLPKHLEFQLYRILLDSAAAEHGARVTAMEAATKNAGEMIDALTLSYNRIRQAAITKEIIEIVSGAAAQG